MSQIIYVRKITTLQWGILYSDIRILILVVEWKGHEYC